MMNEDNDSDNDESMPDLVTHNVVRDDDSSDEEDEEEQDFIESSDGDYHKAEQSTINPKVLRELKKLDTSYNPVLDDIYET